MVSVCVLGPDSFWPAVNSSKNRAGSGQIALPFILLVSGIIIEIAIAGSFVAYYLSTSGLGTRLALRAEAAAKAGIDDAIVRVTQNKEFAATGANYSLIVDSDSTVVNVSRTANSSANIYIYTIVSTSTAGTRQKKFTAVVTVNQTTGQVQLQSVVEISVT